MGDNSKSEVVDLRVKEDENVKIDNINLKVMYTPGHTDCSYSYLMNDRVFTGDTLLINGTGGTDFQNGNARQQYDSIFNKLLKLPERIRWYFLRMTIMVKNILQLDQKEEIIQGYRLILLTNT